MHHDTTTASSATTIALRADHVQLYFTYLGVPINPTRAEQGWLVLSSDGGVHFYKQTRLDLGQPPTFSAPSVKAFAVKVGTAYVRAQFSNVKRFVYFTGYIHPGGDRGESDVAAAAGGALGNEALKQLGDAAHVAQEFKVLLNNRGYRQRKLAARSAWFSVLRGTKPWQSIDTARSS